MVKTEDNIVIHIPNLVMTALVHCLCPAMDAFAKKYKRQSRFVATIWQLSEPSSCFKHTVYTMYVYVLNIPNSDQRKKKEITIGASFCLTSLVLFWSYSPPAVYTLRLQLFCC